MGKQSQQNRSEQRKQPNEKNQTPPGQDRRQRDENPSDDEMFEEDAE